MTFLYFDSTELKFNSSKLFCSVCLPHLGFQSSIYSIDKYQFYNVIIC